MVEIKVLFRDINQDEYKAHLAIGGKAHAKKKKCPSYERIWI